MIYLDDHIGTHPKALRAGSDAMWAWTCGLGYCHQHGSRGVIPKEAVATLGTVRDPARAARRLVEVGLWEDKGDHYVVHDWGSWNGKADRRRDQARAAANARWSGHSPDESDAGAMPPHMPEQSDSTSETNADALPEQMREQDESNASRARARASARAPDESLLPTPESQSSSSSSDPRAAPPTDDDDGSTNVERSTDTVVDMLARRDLAARVAEAGNVGNEGAWLRTARERIAKAEGGRIRAELAGEPDASLERIADLVRPPPARNSARADPLDETQRAQRAAAERHDRERAEAEARYETELAAARGEPTRPSFDELRQVAAGGRRPAPDPEEPF